MNNQSGQISEEIGEGREQVLMSSRRGRRASSPSMEDIRQFVMTQFVDRAIASGLSEITITARAVYAALGPKVGLSLICRAIDTAQFVKMAGLRITDRVGPPAGNEVVWQFQRETP